MQGAAIERNPHQRQPKQAQRRAGAPAERGPSDRQQQAQHEAEKQRGQERLRDPPRGRRPERFGIFERLPPRQQKRAGHGGQRHRHPIPDEGPRRLHPGQQAARRRQRA